MKTKRQNILIGQSGGPTAVINQSLWGVVSTLQGERGVRHLLGARRGVEGILAGDLVDLRATGRRRWKAVAATPGAALGSVRKKPDAAECARLLERFEELEVGHFFYIGGNDSAETASILAGQARAQGRELSVWHVPKTIDNDLRVTDHCPGYGSAARFVACAFLGDEEDNRSLGGVKINVLMGRDAGWLTAASVLARTRKDAAPHLVYVPERVFDLQAFLADVDATVKRIGRCVVAVSEGVRDASGAPIGATGEKDSHGNLQLSGSGHLGDFLASAVKTRLGIKRVRADTFGYLQRSFAGCVSEVDAEEAFAVGAFAAEGALSGRASGGSVVLERAERKRYRSKCRLVEVEKLAKATRPLDERFLGRGADIAESFVDWASPLVGELPPVAQLEFERWTPGPRGRD